MFSWIDFFLFSFDSEFRLIINTQNKENKYTKYLNKLTAPRKMKEHGVVNEEVLMAKSFLKSKTSKTSNVYDNIGKIIDRTLSERAGSTVDLLDHYADEKKPLEVFTEDDYSKQSKISLNQISLFETEYVREDAVEQEEEFEIPIPNCLKMAFLFEQAGIGLSREEIYKISLAMKYLVYNYPLSSARFWGKLFGIEANYYIAEVEFREGEGEDENADEEEEEEKAINSDDDDRDGPTEEDNFPANTWKPPPQIIKEDHHSGANKYVYFVCNEPGEPWVKLPHVSPEEISVARDINKFFTGRLDSKVTTYPLFPGDESNYLRAQIARISASTLISPAGYFVFDDEEEEEEEDEVRDSYMINSEFEGLSLREMIDPSMTSWAHHSQYILPQGRCTWYNPYEKPEDDFEEDVEEEEDQPIVPLVVPETGPNLLASVGEDKGIGNVSAWSCYASSEILPEYSVAVARSNTWPGAFAIGKGNIFENIYLGWGKKYSSYSYAPPQPPTPQSEYLVTEEITEQIDPTVEEEYALEEKKAANDAADEMDEDDVEDEDEED